MGTAWISGYERRLALSKDTTNVKWRLLHEGAKFNATGRRNKKLMARNNWYKRKAEDSIVTSPKKRRKSEEEQEDEPDAGPGVGNVVVTGAGLLVSNETEVVNGNEVGTPEDHTEPRISNLGSKQTVGWQ